MASLNLFYHLYTSDPELYLWRFDVTGMHLVYSDDTFESLGEIRGFYDFGHEWMVPAMNFGAILWRI